MQDYKDCLKHKFTRSNLLEKYFNHPLDSKYHNLFGLVLVTLQSTACGKIARLGPRTI